MISQRMLTVQTRVLNSDHLVQTAQIDSVKSVPIFKCELSFESSFDAENSRSTFSIIAASFEPVPQYCARCICKVWEHYSHTQLEELSLKMYFIMHLRRVVVMLQSFTEYSLWFAAFRLQFQVGNSSWGGSSQLLLHALIIMLLQRVDEHAQSSKKAWTNDLTTVAQQWRSSTHKQTANTFSESAGRAKNDHHIWKPCLCNRQSIVKKGPKTDSQYNDGSTAVSAWTELSNDNSHLKIGWDLMELRFHDLDRLSQMVRL